jgi:hypothetical protein
MQYSSELGLRKKTINEIILKAVLIWSVGYFVFGVIEFWMSIVKYNWGFQHVMKIVFGLPIYVFIGMVVGGILGAFIRLFSTIRKTDWPGNIHLESFFMAANISFVAFIWITVWMQDVYGINTLSSVLAYASKIGLVFILFILGKLIYRFLRMKKFSERLMIFYIAFSFSFYTFLAIGMYLKYLYSSFIIKSITMFLAYNLLNLIGCTILGLVVYFLSLLIMKFNWLYRTGIVIAVTVIITLALSFSNSNVEAEQEKPNKTNIVLNKSDLLNRKKPNVLLITIDTLRADSLSCYGYKEIESLFADSLAANGVLFTRAISQSPWTLPSCASILTSLYPTVHGAQKRESKNTDSFFDINKNVVMLPEILKGIGYSTQAFVNNEFILSSFGFSKGFDDYCNLEGLKNNIKTKLIWERIYKNFVADEISPNDTITITQKAINWLESQIKQPFFLWIHYFDPHAPYERYKTYGINQGYRGRLKDIEFARGLHFENIKVGRYNLNNSDKKYLKTIYDEEILLVDENIGLILKKLEELNLIDNTLIVLSSDHGEEFWDHNDYEHGHSLYRELVHIPLIFKLPGILPGLV